MHRLVLIQMRQDDAVEAPVGAKVEQHELAVGLSLGQRRLNVLVGVRALVVRPLRARRGVRANGECQEGTQREPLHTGLHGPTGIWEVYTARASRVFDIPADSSAPFASARAIGFPVWKTVTSSGVIRRGTSPERAGETQPCPSCRGQRRTPRDCDR